MKNYKCPLCASADSYRITSSKSSSLIALYKAIDINITIDAEKISLIQCKACKLKFFDPYISGDSDFYTQLKTSEAYYLEEKHEYHFAAKFIDKTNDVLEIGAGKGAFTKFIKCKSYLGLELSKAAIIEAGKENIVLLDESIQEHAKQKASKYDVVAFFQVLEHINCNDLQSFLAASVQCLNVGGYLIISVPNDDSFPGKLYNSTLNMPPHHTSRWPEKTLFYLCNILPLQVVAHDFDIPLESQIDDILIARFSKLSPVRFRLSGKINLYFSLISRLVRLMPGSLKKHLAGLNKQKGHSSTFIFQKTDQL